MSLVESSMRLAAALLLLIFAMLSASVSGTGAVRLDMAPSGTAQHDLP